MVMKILITNRALAENTNLERYGTEWYSKTEDWKTKTRETCMQKYGVKYHCILNQRNMFMTIVSLTVHGRLPITFG